jgi:hypothetical protein
MSELNSIPFTFTSHMKLHSTNGLWKISGAAGLLLAGIAAHGQLIVDAAGPRNAFALVPGKGNTNTTSLSDVTNTLFSSWNANLQASGTDPSLSVSKAPQALQFHPEIGVFVFGFEGKITANNGVSQLFSDVPQINFAQVFNFTTGSPQAGIFSLTCRTSGQYNNNYTIFDSTLPVGSQRYTRDWVGAAEYVTLAYDFPGNIPLSVAISGGWVMTNNYASMPAETIGTLVSGGGGSTVIKSGKTVHAGQFHDYDAFPLSVLPSIDLAGVPGFKTIGNAHWLAEVFNWRWIKSFAPKLPLENINSLILSPYATVIPADRGTPSDAIGLNIVVASVTPFVIGTREGVTYHDYSKTVASFPISLFIDRENAIVGKPSIVAGAALTWAFP